MIPPWADATLFENHYYSLAEVGKKAREVCKSQKHKEKE